MSSKKLAICTHKGGTGKTVTTLALSAILASKSQRCLLIDLDPQGHSTVGAGVDASELTMREFFSEHPSRPLKDIIRRTSRENLDLAPSDLRLAWTAEGLSGRPKKEELLRRGLRHVDDAYKWILMDTPPSLGVLTQNAITAADFVIIPTVLEARAGEALADILELLHLMKGDNCTEYGILLTRVDSRTTRTNAAAREALAPFHQKIFETLIPESEPLNQAQMARQDIITFNPTSKGALAYQEFVAEFMNL